MEALLTLNWKDRVHFWKQLQVRKHKYNVSNIQSIFMNTLVGSNDNNELNQYINVMTFS